MNSTEVFGHERANMEVFKALRALGAEVTIGINTLDSGGLVRELLHEQNFETFSIPWGCHWSKKFFRRSPSLFPSNLSRVVRCSKIVGQQVSVRRATHIHVGTPLVYSFVAPLLWKNRSLKLVYRMGDEPPIGSTPNLMIWKSCIRRANRIVANSEFVRSSIQSVVGTGKPVDLIYNTAPRHDLSADVDTESINVRSKECRFLYVGQIAAHKGVGELVQAAINVCHRNDGCRFDIVGGSKYPVSAKLEEQLRHEISASGMIDRIVMHGHVRDPQSFYRQATVLVVPSIFEEPAANVVLEAKSCGVPAIVFPSGGLPELVNHGTTGWVCRGRSAADLIEHFTTCVLQPSVCRQMATACLQETDRRFSEERYQQQWAGVYRSEELSDRSAAQTFTDLSLQHKVDSVTAPVSAGS